MPKTGAKTDVVVGDRVRSRRKELGLNQEKLARLIGVTLHQIQKFERGTERIGARRLQEIAASLDVPISYFFPEAPNGSAHECPLTEAIAILNGPGALDLLLAFRRISDPAVRSAFIELALLFAESGIEGFSRAELHS